MLRDVVPVDAGHGAEEEIRFVENYWTGKLGDRVGRTNEESLLTRDEYRLLYPRVASLPAGAAILDGGCGAGEWTVLLTEKGYGVTGLDISETLVARLQGLFPGCRWQRGDLRGTGFPDASFDLVFSWGAFEHFEAGLSPCLDEAARILKPSGQLLFSVPFANRRHLRKQKREAARGPEAPTAAAGATRFYQWRFTIPEVQEAVAACGLECDRVLPIHKFHGLQRTLRHDFRLPPPVIPFVERWVAPVLLPFVSARYVAHMLMAIARKPAGAKPAGGKG